MGACNAPLEGRRATASTQEAEKWFIRTLGIKGKCSRELAAPYCAPFWILEKTQCILRESKRESWEQAQVKTSTKRYWKKQSCSVPRKKRLEENMSLQNSKRLLSLEWDKHRIKFRNSFLRTKIMKHQEKSLSEPVAAVSLQILKQVRWAHSEILPDTWLYKGSWASWGEG